MGIVRLDTGVQQAHQAGHRHVIWGARGDVFLQLQVLGWLAGLWLGAVTLACLLWLVLSPPTQGQVHPDEGPPETWGLGSSLAWEALGGEARQLQNDSCR